MPVGPNFINFDNLDVKVMGNNPPKLIIHFEDSTLNKVLKKTLYDINFDIPTPIQKYAIPAAMTGRDVLACSPTGTGKTAAYLLPVINALIHDQNPVFYQQSLQKYQLQPRALVICPTRELALQIYDDCKKVTPGTNVTTSLVIGGRSDIERDLAQAANKDILIATIGRLRSHLKFETVDFSLLRILVLDEADKMIELGFGHDLGKIMADPTMTPKEERQVLMFSATYAKTVTKVAEKYLKDDFLFIVAGELSCPSQDVEQQILEVRQENKYRKLVEVLNENKEKSTIVFVNLKKDVGEIYKMLRADNFLVDHITKLRVQNQRQDALKKLKEEKIQVLVASDVAARGLNIPCVSLVINYDLPRFVREYVNRIGRTGRIGNKGSAISFFDPQYDAHIASHLIYNLGFAAQEVPDFLLPYYAKEELVNAAARNRNRRNKNQQK